MKNLDLFFLASQAIVFRINLQSYSIDIKEKNEYTFSIRLSHSKEDFVVDLRDNIDLETLIK